ncbi:MULTISPECIES: hypothetical protein [Bradyrhizobium]|uniref:Uncharacterized protein n=1 Tax=Bradyrhizobium vignae TaxID=1549949 RepID=A0A2U3Q2M4_9BRAD|nr:hypothetical protein [Bradyrhizobium vignae]RXG87658.1 hypothetical protein EAV90_31880 [Bradyrhizobium vignae]SPP95608.1 membrane protein of unknown function [Bradyrhizobium vignae]
MRRFLVFVLIFPLILTLILSALSFYEDTSVADMQVMPGMIWRGYLIGIVPALVTALVDWLLRRHHLSRILPTALSGYALAAGAGLLMRDVSVFEALRFGFIGAVPAAMCSVFSGKQRLDDVAGNYADSALNSNCN